MSKNLLLEMAKKILVVGGGGAGKLDAMIVMKLKEQYGEDVVLVTPDEAIEQRMNLEDFDDTTGFKMKIFNPYKNSKQITLRNQDAVYHPTFAGGRGRGRGKGDRAKNRSSFLNNFQNRHKRK